MGMDTLWQLGRVLGLLLLLAAASEGTDVREPDLIGWLGEKTQPNSDPAKPHGMEILSWEPRIFVYRGLLTDEECDEIMKLASPRLRRSGVVDSVTGQSKLDDIRTSSGMFFGRGSNPLVKTIEGRIAKWIMLPETHGEGIQVLHYEKTQEYRPHHDYFSHDQADNGGGNRMCTVLMYLSDVEEGGETVFPKVPVPANQTRQAGFSECAMAGLANKPRKGDAIAFWSIKPDGRFDAKSLHGSCPVIKGEKWSATKWVHIAPEYSGRVIREMHVPPPPPDVEGCIDKHKLCNHWAESEECETNANYMVGRKGQPGDCLKSCHRCELGPNDPNFHGEYKGYRQQ